MIDKQACPRLFKLEEAVFWTLLNTSSKAAEITLSIWKEGEPKDKVLTLIRSGVSLYFATQHPYAAITGAALATFAPTTTETLCRTVDWMGLYALKKFSLKEQLAGIGLGVGLYWIGGVPSIETLGTVLAAKVGMEHLQKLMGNEKKDLR